MVKMFRSCEFDRDPMTSIYKLDQYPVKMYPHTKNELSRSRLSKVRVLQSDRKKLIRDRGLAKISMVVVAWPWPLTPWPLKSNQFSPDWCLPVCEVWLRLLFICDLYGGNRQTNIQTNIHPHAQTNATKRQIDWCSCGKNGMIYHTGKGHSCTVSGKKETKMFSVISPMKLGKFWWNLAHSFLNKFAAT